MARLRRATTSAIELLEPRQLLSATYTGNNNYSLNGTTLTVTPVGTSDSKSYTVDNNLSLVGASGVQTFNVSNYPGQLSIDGQGGADTIRINAGAGGTVTIDDSSNSAAQSHLTVAAPATVAADVTLNAGQVLVGGDTVNFTNSINQLTLNGQLFGNADALTVNGSSNDTFNVQGSQLGFNGLPVFYSTFTELTVNAGTGTSSFTVSGDSVPTNLYAGAGNSTFNVISNYVPLSLNGGATGDDQFNIQGNSSTLTANGGAAGSNTFKVISNSSTLTINGGANSPLNTVNVSGNAGNLTVYDAGTANNVHVQSTNAQVTMNESSSGADTLTVDSATAPINFNGTGSTGTSAVTVTAPLYATLTVTGGTGSSRTLTIDGTAAADTFGISSSMISPAGYASVLYSNLTGVTVNGENGNDTFVVSSDSTPTTLMGGTGNDEFDINADTAQVTVNTGTGTSVVNVGSKAPGTGGKLSPIAGGANVIGDGNDTLNIDDSADAAAGAGTLSSTGLSGFGLSSAGPISYSGLLALNLNLGKGGNTLTVTGTSATTTTVNLGSGNDTANVQGTGLNTTTMLNGQAGVNAFNVGSTEPTAGGVVDNVQGVLDLSGNGSDSVTIDDSGNTVAKTGTLTSAALTGISPAPINYTGINLLNVSLGSGGNTLTISSTIAGTTNINTGSGNDTVALLGDNGPTTVNAGNGTNAVNVQAIGAVTMVVGGASGTTTTTVGSNAPASGGVLTNILAALTVYGGGADTLVVDDTGATAAATGTLSPTAVTGLGLPSTGIVYNGVGTIDVNLGNAGNTFTITDTAGGSTANVTSGSGVDTITIDTDSDATNVNTGAGATDAVNVLATGGITHVTTNGNVVVGSLAPVSTGGTLANIAGTLTVDPASLTLDDSGDTSSQTGTLTSGSLTGLSPAAINYVSVGVLNLKLGTGGDDLNIQGTGATTTNITAAGGSNTFDITSTAPTAGGVTAGIGGTLNLTGAGSDVLTIDDAGDTHATSSTLSPTQLTGLTTNPITYAGIGTFTVDLGTAANALTISNTITGSTTINGGASADTITLAADSGPTTINSFAGNDVVYVRTTGATTIVNAGPSATVDVSTTAPTLGGKLTSLNGALTVNGSGSATLNLDDTGVSTSVTANVSASTVIGLSPTTISYSSLGALNLSLGNTGNTLNVTGTSATITTLNTGSGNDTVNVSNTGAATVINAGSGNDTVSVTGTGAATTVNTGPGTNSTVIGSKAPSANGTLAGIAGVVTINGGGVDTLTVDDTGDTAATSSTLTGTTFTGISPAAINFIGLANLNLNLGSGGDTLAVATTPTLAMTIINSGTGNDDVTIQNDAGPTTLNTQAGNDIVKVLATSAATIINTNTGTDTITVGSVGPAPAGGVLTNIAGALTVNGNGTDVLTLDDTGLATAATGAMNASTVTGLSPATITYSKVGSLTVDLGNVGNTFTVTTTAAGTSTVVNGGSGADTINVKATAGSTVINTGTGADVVNVGSNAPATGGTVNGVLNNSLTVNGSGNNATLNVDDTGTTAARSATISATTNTIGPVSLAYSSLSNLNLKLGSGVDTVTVASTAALTSTTVTTGSAADLLYVQNTNGPLTVNGGAGKNTFIVSSLAPAKGGTLNGLLGNVTLNGSGADSLSLDDTGSTVGKAGTLSATQFTGFSAGSISYAGMASLSLNFGGGGDVLNITGTNATTNTTINDGTGEDTINILNDNGPTTVNTENGMVDHTNVLAIHGSTTVHAGGALDVITVGSIAPNIGGSLSGIQSPLAVTGLGNATLILDDSTDTVAKTVGISASSITGLTPSSLPYSGMIALKIYTGTGGSAVNVTGTSTKNGTTITAEGGSNVVTVMASASGGLAAALAGPVSIVGAGADSLTVDDSTDTTGRTVAIGSSSITGFGQTISYSGQGNLAVKFGSGSDTLTATDPAVSAVTYTGNGGTNSATLKYSGNLTGSATLSGFATTTATITGNLTGAIFTSGKLTMTVGGNAPGSITAGSVGTIGVAAAKVGAGNVALAVNQAGIVRQVIANPVSNGSLSNLSFKLLYDGTATNPQLAARVSNPSNVRFDFELAAPVGSNFDLSRLDTASATTAATIRNVIVEGSVLKAVTSGETSYFAYPAGTTAGVYLPVDNLAGVTSWGSVYANTIRAASIEGVAFATLVDSGGKSHTASSLNSESSETTLLTVLAINSSTKKYYEAVKLPTDTILVPFSTKASVALFTDGDEGADDVGQTTGTTNNGDFEEHGLLFTDQAANSPLTSAYASSPIMAAATFASNSSPSVLTSWVTNLSFIGDGGSVDSTSNITSITSTGAVGDLLLRGNATKSSVNTALASITAPAIFGNVDLYGGTLSGVIQTTGVRTDPTTGATSKIAADLGRLTTASGSVNGATYLHANLTAGSKVVSRGNLFSTVQVDTGLFGTIAAAGNIGGIATGSTGSATLSKTGAVTRYGGIQIKGTGTANVSTGQVVALGNIYGDVSFAGNFSGRIVAQGAAVSGLTSTRIGMLGNVSLPSSGLVGGGAIISGGEVGDSANGTKLTAAGTSAGYVAAKGAVVVASTVTTGHLLQNQSNTGSTASNAAAIDAIFTDNHVKLSFDLSGLDLAGLGKIQTDASNLKLSGSVLSGTTA